MAEVIQVDSREVQLGLGRFGLSLSRTDTLMRNIGLLMLVSIRRTFRESGSPAGSWPALAASTLRNKRLYKDGHKLLILSGRLLNSITYRVSPGQVEIGTNLKYAAVQQYGSADYAAGPRTEEQSKSTVSVSAYQRFQLGRSLGKGKLGSRERRIQGPRVATIVKVIAHKRHQNIPPRPYLVFRPEDPERINSLVDRFIGESRHSVGLGGAQ
jgi:phage gpG-like protein